MAGKEVNVQVIGYGQQEDRIDIKIKERGEGACLP